MKKFSMTLAAAALALGAMVASASAQSQQAGAASFHAQIQNATPVVQQAACRGYGPYCGPGFVRTCGPYRCWCRPCY
jgi:hypothetical protein